METVVNNPPQERTGSGMGVIIAIIVLLFLAFLFFYYGLPALNQPASPQINVPEQVDVNVNQPAQ